MRSIVVDASAIVDLVLDLPPSRAIVERLGAAGGLFAPHLIDAEVAQVLRRHVLRGTLGSGRAWQALDDLADLPLRRYPHAPFLARAFELRDNATIYDGLYLALAEALDAVFLTRDARLADVPNSRARIELIQASC